MKSALTFDRWFAEQHGSPPSKKSQEQLARELSKLRAKCAALEMTVRAQELWEWRRTSALWAWQAATGDITGGLQ